MGRSFPPLPCPSCETGTMRLARGRVSTLARRNVTVHLRDFEAPRCDNSRCDEVFTQEVDEEAIHAAANAVLAEETWRTLLARDVAEVERALPCLTDVACRSQGVARSYAEDAWWHLGASDADVAEYFKGDRGAALEETVKWQAYSAEWHQRAANARERLATCQAWLTRARAALDR